MAPTTRATPSASPATKRRTQETSMKLFQRVFFAAVLAGLAAGLVMSAVQQWRVAPLILAAEEYEGEAPIAAHTHEAGTPAHDHGDAHAHDHDEDAWAPQDGAERIFYTVL